MRKQLDVNFGDERIRNCGIGNTIKNKEGNDGNRDRDIYREGKRYIGRAREIQEWRKKGNISSL